MAKIRNYLILLGGAGVVVALDQWSKYLVSSRLEVGQTWMPIPWLAPYARIIHWSNTGAAFGLFPSGSLIFTIVAVIVSAAILYYFPRVPANQIALRVALAMQLGGAIGNLIDRVVHGTVIDFISLGTFPVFNLADSSISVGLAVLVAAMWLEERHAKAGSKGELSPPVEGDEGGSHAEHPLG